MSWNSRLISKNVGQLELNELMRSSSLSIRLDWNLPEFTTKLHGPMKFSRMVGIGVHSEFKIEGKDWRRQFKDWIDVQNDLVLGYFNYNLKNELEQLRSENEDSVGFPLLHFFVPETVIMEINGELTTYSHSKKPEVEARSEGPKPHIGESTVFLDAQEYVQRVAAIKAHIQQGDIYEMNFCIEQRFVQTTIDPIRLFDELKQASPAPFSTFLNDHGKLLIGSSPERFMMKKDGRLFSQPMKGTNRRVADNEAQKEQLRNDPKEVAENVMISDLVRNDLSRSAKKGSVVLDELCGVYEFQHVNTMISTISAELREDVHPVDAILSAFPMGSMTGAPKIRAMELIDQFESFSRGLYSGAVGYFTPELDFDFNVVIRSILYDEETKVVTFPTGSAITINSDPAKEYEECMLKAEAMRKVLLDHAK